MVFWVHIFDLIRAYYFEAFWGDSLDDLFMLGP